MPKTTVEKSALKKLELLREDCNVELKLSIHANNKEYENTAAILLWWLSTKKINNLLETMYQQQTRKIRDVEYGINFRPLLQLVYGNNISDIQISRKSKALNAIKDQYEKDPSFYKKDGVAKLANFIKTSGGMNALVNPSNDKNSTTKDLIDNLNNLNNSNQRDAVASNSNPAYLNARQIVQIQITNEDRMKTLVAEAQEYFFNTPASYSTTINPQIPTNNKKYSVVLIRKSNAGYELLHAEPDDWHVKHALVLAYRDQFEAIPKSLRCIYEIIRTQLISKAALKHATYLEHDSNFINAEGKAISAKRRLMFRHSTNEFILSPQGSDQGVVTLAKPKGQILESVTYDVFMPILNRKIIEERLLIPRDYNLFKTNNEDIFPRYRHGSAVSHLLRIDNKNNVGDFIFHDFWPFSRQTVNVIEQLDYDTEHDNICTVNIKLSANTLKSIAVQMAQPWLNNVGANIKRDQNKLWQITINENKFAIEFDYVDQRFRNEDQLEFDKPLSDLINYRSIFLSQDVVPSLATFAALKIDGDVEVLASEHALIFSFSTSAADYKMCIPTCTIDLKRSRSAFKIYTPDMIEDDEESDEYIDKIVYGNQPDNYEDILLGSELEDIEWVVTDGEET